MCPKSRLPQFAGDLTQRWDELVVEDPSCRVLHGGDLLIDRIAGDDFCLLGDLCNGPVLGFARHRGDAPRKGIDAAQQLVGHRFQPVTRLLERRRHRVDAGEQRGEVAERLGDQDFAGIARAAHDE